MQDGLYVALSSHRAVERRLATLANNVANAGTVGYRATTIRFEEAVGNRAGSDMAFVSTGREHLDLAGGGMLETGNPLDLAVDGRAWFAIETPAGMVLTRDGRFSMTADGALVSASGHPVLDAAGSPIQLSPQGGEPVIGRDGIVRQDGAIVSGVGLFEFDPPADALRFGQSGIVADTSAEPAVDRRDVGVLQGWVEQSNVDPMRELTRLIALQRVFEGVASAISRQEDGLGAAVRTMTG